MRSCRHTIRAGLLAGVLAVVSFAVVWRAHATSCASGGGQLLRFDLVEVTEDGAPADPSVYDGWNINTLAEDDTSVVLRAEFNDFNNVYLETYHVSP
jgi:hypothetical protein